MARPAASARPWAWLSASPWAWRVGLAVGLGVGLTFVPSVGAAPGGSTTGGLGFDAAFGLPIDRRRRATASRVSPTRVTFTKWMPFFWSARTRNLARNFPFSLVVTRTIGRESHRTTIVTPGSKPTPLTLRILPATGCLGDTDRVGAAANVLMNGRRSAGIRRTIGSVASRLRVRRLGAGSRAGWGVGASKTQSRRSAMAMFRNGLTSWGRGVPKRPRVDHREGDAALFGRERFGIQGSAAFTGPLTWAAPPLGRGRAGRSVPGGRGGPSVVVLEVHATRRTEKDPTDPLPTRGPRTTRHWAEARIGSIAHTTPPDPSATGAPTLDHAMPGWTPNREGVVGCGALMHGKYRPAGEVSAGAVGHRFPCGAGPGPPHDPVLG